MSQNRCQRDENSENINSAKAFKNKPGISLFFHVFGWIGFFGVPKVSLVFGDLPSAGASLETRELCVFCFIGTVIVFLRGGGFCCFSCGFLWCLVICRQTQPGWRPQDFGFGVLFGQSLFFVVFVFLVVFLFFSLFSVPEILFNF